MKTWDRIIPHLIAIGLFMVVLFSFFFPALKGKVVEKQDKVRAWATASEIRADEEKTGEPVLWTNSMFGGMPTFQKGLDYDHNLMKRAENWTKLNFGPINSLPDSLGLIFTLFLGFYFLLWVFGCSPWVCLIGGIGYAFSTYFITSYEAGHTGKLRTIGFIAPVMASIYMTFEQRRVLGAALTALFTAIAITTQHIQITYYLALIILIFMIAKGIEYYKKDQLRTFFKVSALLLFCGVIAVGPSTSKLWCTWEYSQSSIRGGGSSNKTEGNAGTEGLDRGYAMKWSYGPIETFNLLIPGLYGSSSNEALGESSVLYEDLKQKGVPENRLDRILGSIPLYWGPQPFTSGPVYLGASVIFLFLAGFLITRNRVKWWALVVLIMAILMSWGRHFPSLNYFLFDHLPLYNKFRSPSIILTLACFVVPFIAALGVNDLVKGVVDRQKALKHLKYALFITGGICLFFLILGPALFDFQSPQDQRLAEQGFPIDKLRAERKALLSESAIRSLVFILLTYGATWAFAQNRIRKEWLFVFLGLFVTIDLFSMNKNYLNERHFTRRGDPGEEIRRTKADAQILQDDDPHFRVYNTTRGLTNDGRTSYFHKSIGGYHGAKMWRYQRLIEQHISKGNRSVLNMLNTKYYITKKEQGRGTKTLKNPNALGNGWFVKDISWKETPAEVLEALDDKDLSKTAIINEKWKDKITAQANSPFPSNGKIELTHYEPNRLTYKTELKENGSKGLAVFSEIYYKGGQTHDWKVFVDGKPADHFRVNYVLRGMLLPPGEHEVEFVFQPNCYYTGGKISLASSILIYLLVISGIIYERRKKKRAGEEDTESA